MRPIVIVPVALGAAAFLTACEKPGDADVEKAMQAINVIDESNLNSVMLASADPNEAVSYFQRAVAANPERIDLLRGLAQSLVRAGKFDAAAKAWEFVVAHPEAEDDDRVDFADALIRQGNWDAADKVLDGIAPTHETYKRYRLEAMVADSNQEWAKADSFYEIAIGLTTRPAGVYNNWGYSKLTRGDYTAAEKLFGEALKFDSSLFTAKNNLVLARAAQRNYDLPVIPMSQIERAQLLHTAGLAAIKQGDVLTGKSLLKQAIDTHPQYFEAAVRSLAALEENVVN